MNERHLTMQSEKEVTWILKWIYHVECRGNLEHPFNPHDTKNLKLSFLLVKFPQNENF